MGTRLFDLGRQKFLGDGGTTISWVNDSIKFQGYQLDGTLTATAVKAISTITTATPPVVTSTGHGFANNDKVIIRGVVGMPEANNTWIIQGVTANTFQLTNLDGTNGIGVNTYTSGGCVIDVTKASFLSDVSGAAVGAASAAVTGKTATNGTAQSGNATLAAFPNGNTLHGYASYKDTGTSTTSPLIHFADGRAVVRCTETGTAGDTTISVDKLEGGIANGTVLVWTNGQSTTLGANANQGDTQLTITPALTTNIPRVGDTVDAPWNVTPNLPINGNGGDLTIVPDASKGWFTL